MKSRGAVKGHGGTTVSVFFKEYVKKGKTPASDVEKIIDIRNVAKDCVSDAEAVEAEQRRAQASKDLGKCAPDGCRRVADGEIYAKGHRPFHLLQSASEMLYAPPGTKGAKDPVVVYRRVTPIDKLDAWKEWWKENGFKTHLALDPGSRTFLTGYLFCEKGEFIVSAHCLVFLRLKQQPSEPSC